jgi:hypothetical protein
LRSSWASIARKLVHAPPFLLHRLHALALAHVAHHLRETDVLAVGVVQRRRVDVGPEPAAVLAHAPADVLRMTVGERIAKQFGRAPARTSSFVKKRSADCPITSAAV